MNPIRDNAKTIITPLPAAGADATGYPLDLGQPGFGETTIGDATTVTCEISIPATPNLVEDKTITATVYHGDTRAELAALDPSISTTVTGTATGGAAKAVSFRLPPNCKRFVAVNYAVEAGGGDNRALDAHFCLLF